MRDGYGAANAKPRLARAGALHLHLIVQLFKEEYIAASTLAVAIVGLLVRLIWVTRHRLRKQYCP